MSDAKNICFVISPIGADGSDIRNRADKILKHVLKPAALACGFEAIRADEISEPGMITSQVIQHIIDDPLVIADLTGTNANVFYELALRHAIRKPLVQIMQKDDKLPFDVAGMRTISVDHTDLDSVEDAKKEIIKQINTIVKKKPEEIESPISVSLELQALKHSDKPEERSFAEFLAALSELRSDIGAIEKRLTNPETLLPPQYIQKVFDAPSRRSNRELDMWFVELTRRFDRIVAMTEDKKQNPLEVKNELSRFYEMLMMIRHELMRG
ncbi:MAG: hypothetical protein AB1746_03940 [Candidatus Zixiibacteriota bacterium]